MRLRSLVTLTLVICQCVGVSHPVGQRGVSFIGASGVNSALPSTVWGVADLIDKRHQCCTDDEDVQALVNPQADQELILMMVR